MDKEHGFIFSVLGSEHKLHKSLADEKQRGIDGWWEGGESELFSVGR